MPQNTRLPFRLNAQETPEEVRRRILEEMASGRLPAPATDRQRMRPMAPPADISGIMSYKAPSFSIPPAAIPGARPPAPTPGPRYMGGNVPPRNAEGVAEGTEDLGNIKAQIMAKYGIPERNQAVGGLETATAISEALGNMRFPTAAQIEAGTYQKNRKPFIDYNLRQKLAEQKDVLTDEEREMMGGIFGSEIPAGMQFSRVSEMFPHLSTMIRNQAVQSRFEEGEQAEKDRFNASQTRLKEEAALKRGERQDTKLERFRQDFLKNPRVRDNKMKIDEANKAIAAIQIGTAIGDIASLVSALRASGERGALSDQDMNRWQYRMGLVNKMEDFFSRWGAGRLSKEQQGEIKQLLQEYVKHSKEAIREEAQTQATGFSNIHDIDEAWLKGKVLLPDFLEGPEEASASTGASGMMKIVHEDGEEGEVPIGTPLPKGWRPK